MMYDGIGPKAEQTYISKAEDKAWWQFLRAFYHSECEEYGSIRPTFSKFGANMLKHNGSGGV